MHYFIRKILLLDEVNVKLKQLTKALYLPSIISNLVYVHNFIFCLPSISLLTTVPTVLSVHHSPGGKEEHFNMFA